MDKPYLQSGDYIPRGDSAFRDWLLNFATLIAADPTRYGLDTGDATTIASLSDDYDAAYQPVQAPSTRTPSAVAQKDAVKASAVASVRVYAQLIKANGGVTNDDKIALGIHVNDTTPTPIPEPRTAPVLMIVGATSGVHQIRYADETTPASRAKPFGAIQLLLYRYVGDAATADPAQASFIGPFTKNPVLVDLDAADAGKVATYFGRWVTRTGLMGPWSLPQSMTIAFGGAAESAPTGGTSLGAEDLKIAA